MCACVCLAFISKHIQILKLFDNLSSLFAQPPQNPEPSRSPSAQQLHDLYPKSWTRHPRRRSANAPVFQRGQHLPSRVAVVQISMFFRGPKDLMSCEPVVWGNLPEASCHKKEKRHQKAKSTWWTSRLRV